MNPVLMMLLQMIMQGQQNQPPVQTAPPMPPQMPMGPMESPAPMSNFPIADPTANVPNYQALAKSYMQNGRNI